MTWPKRLLFTGIYGIAAVLLWVWGNHEVYRYGPVIGGAGIRGGVIFIATPGFLYLASIVCAALAFLSLIGKLPRIPEDEPNI